MPGEPGSAQRGATDAFFLPGGKTGALLVHGFTGSPWEMRFLGDTLQSHGHTVSGVRLAGHGTQPQDMEACAWTDWYGSVEAAFDELAQQVDRVFVIGQSMGALLALELVARHPDRIQALALLAPALITSMSWLPWVTPLIPTVLTLTGERTRFLPKKGGSDIADDTMRRAIPSYDATPLRSVGQLTALQEHVRRRLPDIRRPVLVVHSRQDHTCPLENVAILQRELPGSVRCLILRDSYHVISIDLEREQVATEVASFLASHAA